jgi:hypothetical protein
MDERNKKIDCSEKRKKSHTETQGRNRKLGGKDQLCSLPIGEG